MDQTVIYNGQILTDICQILIEIDHPQDTALSVQRVLFQQLLFKAEAQEYHIFVVEVLHHSRADAGFKLKLR